MIEFSVGERRGIERPVFASNAQWIDFDERLLVKHFRIAER